MIDVRMACEQRKREKFELPPFEMLQKLLHKFLSILKADDEIKVRRRIFTLKTLIYV